MCKSYFSSILLCATQVVLGSGEYSASKFSATVCVILLRTLISGAPIPIICLIVVLIDINFAPILNQYIATAFTRSLTGISNSLTSKGSSNVTPAIYFSVESEYEYIGNDEIIEIENSEHPVLVIDELGSDRKNIPHE